MEIQQSYRVFQLCFVWMFYLTGSQALAQNSAVYRKSDYALKSLMPEVNHSLYKLSDNRFYGAGGSIERDTLMIDEYDFRNDRYVRTSLVASQLGFEGLSDYYVADSMIYLLVNNASKVITYNRNTGAKWSEWAVSNLHSNLYEYSEIYAYKSRIYLLYIPEMTLKSDDTRNLFIDVMDSGGKVRNVFSYTNTTNFFLISDYRNYEFYKGKFYFSDIVGGSVYGIDLTDPKGVPEIILEGTFDKDHYRLNRTRQWEASYRKTKNSAPILDSIRYFFAHEFTSTRLSVHNDLLVVLDKYPGDTCSAVFRTVNIKSGETECFYVLDEMGRCIRPMLSFVYIEKDRIFQFYNYFDPDSGKVMRFYRYDRIKP